MSSDRENALERLLKDIINDFDQEGCSSGVGTVSTSSINEARDFLGMDHLEDEVEDESDEDESDEEDSTP